MTLAERVLHKFVGTAAHDGNQGGSIGGAARGAE